MSEKSKEVDWKRLPLSEKKEFDVAQAKEISNVVISKALRNLTKEELDKLDEKRVMSMRWVLTRKTDGTAKARLVILGFMARNLTEVATASPTLSKVGRNLVLTLSANLKFIIRGGDVTAAFLQTGTSLEDEELTILAPPELAAMFGAVMLSLGWKQLKGEKCVYVLQDPSTGKICGLAGLHVDDFLLSGDPNSTFFDQAQEALLKEFRWGKWETEEFTFAGCRIRQAEDFSITLDQEDYTDKWIEEIKIDPTRARRSPLLPAEISALRGALGTVSWRATQTAPQYLADTSLLLSEISKGTVETLYKTNKLIREMRANASQGLWFPSWGREIKDLAVIVWADASQHNRPDKSSTIGILAGIGPKEMINGEEHPLAIEMINGEEHPLAIVQWRSSKTPRQCLGSNGAEVQAVTIGEDICWNLRMLLAELCGEEVRRDNLHEIVKVIEGAVVMDTRGIYDAITRNLSPLHGLREARAGYELTLAVNQGVQSGVHFRWVNGLAQLADAMTKTGTRKILLQFFGQRQHWRLVHDNKFESGRRVHKKELEKRLKEMEENFVNFVSYAVPALLPAVTDRAMELAAELSPKQLTHTLQGLSRSQLDSEPLLAALKRRAQQLAHVLFGTHAVTVLVALSDCRQLDHQILKTLSETILRHLDRLSAQDYIAVLSTLSRVPEELRSALPVSCVEELLQALRSRGYGPWRLELEAVVHLLEALHGLRLEDEVLLELLLDRLPAAMQLSDVTLTLLLRLFEGLADLPKRSRAQVAAHLHRRRKLQNALKESLYKQVTSKNLDLEAQVVIAKAIARLGYEEPLTQEFLERLTYSPELPSLSLDAACDLCFTLAQQSWLIEWNRRFTWKLLHALYGLEIPQALQDDEPLSSTRAVKVEPGSLLRLAWALTVLDEALPLPLLEQLADLPLPRDWGGYGLKQLQEVALHHQLQVAIMFGEHTVDKGANLSSKAQLFPMILPQTQNAMFAVPFAPSHRPCVPHNKTLETRPGLASGSSSWALRYGGTTAIAMAACRTRARPRSQAEALVEQLRMAVGRGGSPVDTTLQQL
eukprot:s1625_g14.t1